MPSKNSLFVGDCRIELKRVGDDTIDLVYLDPPFFSQSNHKLRTRDNSQEYEFSDSWDSLEEYLSLIRDSLIEIKRVLKKTGSVFLHCDKAASHHLRILLDEVFGRENFVNEIVWHYKRWSNSKKGLLNAHQNIYFYGKTSNFKFNNVYGEYSPTTNVDQILQRRIRDENNKSVYARDDEGNPILNGVKKGVPLSDVWEIPFLNPKAGERSGYPTQKPILLLERIIQLVTDKGDVVLDPFCGSGTTLVSAKLLGREYIGIDISSKAINLTKQRLQNSIKTSSRLLKVGKEAYNQKPEAELAMLNALNAFPVYRNKGIDGFLKEEFHQKPIPVRIQKPNEHLSIAKSKLFHAAKLRSCEFMVLISISSSDRDEAYIEEVSSHKLLVIPSYGLVIKKLLYGKPTLKMEYSLAKYLV